VSRRRLAALALALLLGAGLFGWLRLRAAAAVGAGYVAKQMCSCMLVARRSFESCRPDIPPEMDRVGARPLPEGRGVRADVPLLAEREALYSEGSGCTLEP
jgi:hypothetical protein